MTMRRELVAITKDPIAVTLPGRLIYWARLTPERTAIRDKQLGLWREVSWRGYLEQVEAAAHALWELGVRPGDHVSILSGNRPEWLYVDLAAQAIGARSVGIYQTNPPKDVAYILEHSQSKVLFCEDQEQVDKAVDIAEQTPSVDRVLVFDPRGTRDYEDARVAPYQEALEAGVRRMREHPGWFEEQVRARDPKAPSMVVYTSGTTGPPKGAMISSHNVIAGADASMPIFETTANEQILSYLPLCHVAEKIFSLFIPLTAGAVVHFGEAIETVQADLREVSPTIFLGVPRIWEKMHASVTLKMKNSSWLKRTLYNVFTKRGRIIAKRRLEGRSGPLDWLVWRLGDLLVFRPLQERLGLRRCRLPVTGAAPIAPDLLEWFHGVGVKVLEGYGMTESSGVSHLNYPDRPLLGTVGEELPVIETQIAEDGEILVRGPTVFCGYLHNEEATAKTIDAEGWLHTGDVGQIDDKGYLRITGRKKEIIITAGGKNLSPEKIENALKMSPYIKEAVAIGDKRKFIAALVQIDYDAVGDWATRQKITYTSYGDLATKPEVVKLVDKEIKAANELLARVETVRAFKIFPKELHQDDDELTATQKVRRREIHKKYDALIESIYAPKALAEDPKAGALTVAKAEA